MTKAVYKTTGMTIKKLTTCLILFGVFLTCNGLLYQSVGTTDFSKKSNERGTTEQIVTTYANKPVIPAETAQNTDNMGEVQTSTPQSETAPMPSGTSQTAAAQNAESLQTSAEPLQAPSAQVPEEPAQEKAQASSENPAQAQEVLPQNECTAIPVRASAYDTENPPAPPREFVSKWSLPFPFSLFCPEDKNAPAANKGKMPVVNPQTPAQEVEIAYIEIPAKKDAGQQIASSNDSNQHLAENEIPLLPTDSEFEEVAVEPQVGQNAEQMVQTEEKMLIEDLPAIEKPVKNNALAEDTSLMTVLEAGGTIPATQASFTSQSSSLEQAGKVHEAIVQDMQIVRNTVIHNTTAAAAELNETSEASSIPEELDLQKLQAQMAKQEAEKATDAAPTAPSVGPEELPGIEPEIAAQPKEASTPTGTSVSSEAITPTEFPDSQGFPELEEAPIQPHFGLREAVSVTANKPATPSVPPLKTSTSADTQTARNSGLEEISEEPIKTPTGRIPTNSTGLEEISDGLEELQEEPEDFPPIG